MKIGDNANFENISIEDVKQKATTLRGCEFIDCSFKECSFPEVTFEHCTFQNCTFVNCDLSLMSPSKSKFRGVKFANCKLLGVNWSRAAWENQEAHTLLKAVSFMGCNVNYSSFMGLRLPGIILTESVAHEVDFSETNLSKADLRNTDFEKAVFRNTNLAGADLSGAKNYFIDPASNRISKAKFSLPDALGLLYAMDIVIDGDDAE